MALDPHILALSHADVHVRLDAVEKLKESRYVAAIPYLTDMLQDPDSQIRAAVSKALGEMRAESAVAQLSVLLSDPDSNVRVAAQVALGLINTDQSRNILKATTRLMATQKAKPSSALKSDSEDTLFLRKDAVPMIIVPKNAAAEAQFSAYYPKEVAHTQWRGMVAYVFKAFAARMVIEDAQRILGGSVANSREEIDGPYPGIPDGTMITATPHLPGFQFNPPHITLGFYEDWHRFEFKMRAIDAPVKEAKNGYIIFTVNSVIISTLPLSVYVKDSASTSSSMITVMQKLYKAIFCSYSHQDRWIVDRVARAYRALGFDYLRDVDSLKSGEDWDDRLYELITRADIFQLFWSPAAAESEFVEREWRYALALQRPNFIRPVYWEEPMPPAPQELNHIHFAFQSDLDE